LDKKEKGSKKMKLGVLFSGGKDSLYASYLAQKQGHELTCFISVHSKNKESYMFHTPSILATKEQAEVMGIPLITEKTKGEKEVELKDLEKAIERAIKEYKIQGILTGAIRSEYQFSRIQTLCNKLKIKCVNPLWQTDELNYLKDLIKNKFKIIIIGVFAYPFNESWLGRELDEKFINEIKKLNEKFDIHLAGEGGEYESFVLNCPLFKKELKVKSYEDFKEGENSYRRDIKVE
jgi:diphthine-ammonia ligase